MLMSSTCLGLELYMGMLTVFMVFFISIVNIIIIFFKNVLFLSLDF
jgi:hypothetical protein